MKTTTSICLALALGTGSFVLGRADAPSITGFEPNGSGVSPTAPIRIQITDGASVPQASTIQLLVKGAAVTPTISRTGQVTRVVYDPGVLWDFGASVSVKLTFSDTATPPNQVVKQWSFTVVSSVPVVPVAFARPVSSGQAPGIGVRLVQAPANLGLENSTARTEAQLAGGYPTERQVFAAAAVVNYNADTPSQAGYFGNDSQFPGIDPTVNRNNIALEAVAYLVLDRGLYQFVVNSDDGFRMTTGLLPGDNTLVLGEFNGGRGASDSPFSFVVETNGLYLFRLTWEQGTGGANLEWSSVASDTGSRVLINDANATNAVRAFQVCTLLPSPVTVARQPQDTTVPETTSATFSALGALPGTTNTFALGYQWQQNRADLPGATGTNLVTALRRRTDTGAKYRCNITLLGYPAVATSEATLTVTPDNLPPQVISAATLATSPVIGVRFSELMDAASASNPTNYTLSSGARVTQATLQPDGNTVALTMSAMVYTNFTLGISALTDWAGNPLPAGTQTPVAVAALEPTDLGTLGVDLLQRGKVFTSQAGDFDVVAAGSDLWNNTDGGYYLHEVREGDFDVQVRLARLDNSRTWAKAGLMARESLSGGSRHVLAGVSPSDGWNVYFATWRTQADGSSSEWPGGAESSGVPYPNAWVRLKRTGDSFTAYRGTNGVDWTQFAKTTLALTNRLYVGLAASAVNNSPGVTTTAWFRSYTGVPAAMAPGAADLLIQQSASATWASDNVYQPVPSGDQIQTKTAWVGAPATFLVQVQNDNPGATNLVLRASEVGQAKWRVVYRDGTNDITGQLHNPRGFATTNLPAGGSQTISVSMTPAHNVAANTNMSVTITAYLEGYSLNPRDAVQAVATTVPTYQPDLLVRREQDAAYAGDDVINNTGVGQTKSLETDLGTAARYLVQLINHGNMPDQFTLKGGGDANGWTVKYTMSEARVRFDGAAAYVDAGGWGPGRQWTAEAWVMASGTPGGRRSILGGFGACRDWGLTMQDGQFGVALRPPGGCTTTLRTGVAVEAGTWHHLAATCDGTNAMLYIDGVLTNTAPVDPNYTAYENVRLGSEVCCGGNSFPGQIREARVWNRVLGGSEIKNQMNTLLTGAEAGLLGYWRLVFGGGGSAPDLSPNQHDGTLGGGAVWELVPNDVSPSITGAGFTTDVLLPNDSLDLVVEVTPDSSVADGAVLERLLTAASVAQSAQVDAVKLVTSASGPSAVPVSAHYTSSADFDRGLLVGVEDVSVPDQLQLATEAVTQPFIWVPNSNEGTVSKVDTRTGREVARYRTAPSGLTSQPSRTTVDQFGNCWVANRQTGTVIKIGLFENGQYVDRNQDGVIQTSHDSNGDGDITGAELLPWGQDECVLMEVVVIPGKEGTFAPGTFTGGYANDYWNPGPRGVAVDAQGNVWIGTYGSRTFYYVDGNSGRILRTLDVSSVNHTSYGALVDAQGIIWSAGQDKDHLLRLDPKDNSYTVIPVGHYVYGLGIDRNNHLFVAGWTDAKLSRVDVLTGRLEWTRAGINESRGLAVTDDGDVWVANSQPGTVARWSNDGQLKRQIAVGSTPTGAAVDADGKVWVVNNGDEYIHQVDPATDTVVLAKRIVGGTHYGYSDMTGIISRTATVRYGVWSDVHDGKVTNCVWTTVTWQGSDPTGTNLVVRVRSSNDRLAWSPWEQAVNGARLLKTPPGRFLELQVTLVASVAGVSPILYDVSVAATTPGKVDLAAILSATPSPALSEHLLEYTVTVTNLSTNWASGVVVTNWLPVPADLESVNVPGGFYHLTNGLVVLQWAGLGGDAAVHATISLIPSSPGPITNSVTVSANEVELNSANNQATLVVQVSPLQCSAPVVGVIGWWPGDGHARDLIGGSDATVQGGVSYAPAKVLEGFTFGADADRVIVTNADDLNLPWSGFTVEFWMRAVKNQPQGLATIVEKSHGFVDSTGWAFQADSNLGTVGWGVGLGGGGAGNFAGVGSTRDLFDGQFHHVAGTWDGESLLFYVDGTVEGTNIMSVPVGNSRPLNIGFAWGGGNPQRFFRGQVDELSIYQRALSAGEIQAIYDTRSKGQCKDQLIIHLPMRLAGATVGRAYSQPLAAALGLAPYNFTIAAGALPPGLSLSSAGEIGGVPSQAGNYQVTVQVTDSASRTAQRQFTLPVLTCLAPPAGLVGWWPGEGNGDDLVSTNHGTLVNAVTFDEGMVGQAFRFNGVDTKVLIPSSTNLDLSRAARWTVVAWIKPGSFTGQNWPTIFSYGRWRASLGLNQGTGRLESWVNNGEVFVGTNSVPLNSWSHVALVYDGTNRLFFINGVLDAAGTAPKLGAETAPASIGDVTTSPNSSRFNGAIDEVMVYNRNLSPDELVALYTSEFAGLCRPAPITDLMVKVSSADDAAYALRHVLQPVPAGGQIQRQVVAPLTTASYQVRLMNDAPAARAFILRAVETGELEWTVRYHEGTNQLNSLLHSQLGYLTPSLPPGGSYTLTVEVTPGLRVAANAVKTAVVQVMLDPQAATVQDAVEALTTCSPVHRPDLMARRDVDVTYVGEGVYNLTGLNQTKYIDLDPGNTARYLAALANHGNLADRFTLKGTGGGNGWTVTYQAVLPAARFDGSSGYADAGGWTPGSRWTIEAWVNASGTPSGRRSIAGGFSSCRDWGLTMQDGQFGLAIRPVGSCTVTLPSGTAVVVGTWHHLAGTCDGTNAVFYLDGAQVNTANVDPNYTAVENVRIGGEVCCGGNNFPGFIQEVRLWSRALSAAEITVVKNTVLSGTEAGLLGYWHLNEGSGNVAPDRSTNHHDATLGGGVAWDVAPTDVTRDLTGGGWTTGTLPPGASLNLIAEATPDSTVSGGSTKELLLTAVSVGDAAQADAVKFVTTLTTSSSVPVGGTYTSTADFEKGVLLGVDDTTVADQLQLARTATTLPFIWVPNSNEGTVSKVDTRTGRELGRYRTAPAGVNCQPSRTTVDQYGNCWVANRQSGTVVKIGLYESGQYVDRNHDGVIQTSRDLNNDGDITGDELLPWGQDECVLFEVILIPGKEATYVPGSYTGGYVNDYWNPGPRGIAVDALGNVWAGTHDAMKYYYLEGKTAQIMRTNDLSAVGHTPYGAVIDAHGILWSSGYRESGQSSVLRLDPKDQSISVINFNFHTYGLGLDQQDHLFVSGFQEAKLARINVLNSTVDWIVDSFYQARGVAVTSDQDVWVAISSAGMVARYSNDGLLKKTINVGSVPTGVSIDAEGKVWVVNDGDEYIHRIDPATDTIDLTKRVIGGIHYGYSDMTGIISRSATVQFGTWTVVHNSKVTNTAWGLVAWETGDPSGTNVAVRARSSNDQQRWSDWETARNAVNLTNTPPGKYLQVEVTLRVATGDVSPVLYSLTIEPASGGAPSLRAQLRVDGTVEISWLPPSAGVFALEYTEVLGPAAVWRAVTDTPTSVGGRWVVTVNAQAGTRFFRLHSP